MKSQFLKKESRKQTTQILASEGRAAAGPQRRNSFRRISTIPPTPLFHRLFAIPPTPLFHRLFAIPPTLHRNATFLFLVFSTLLLGLVGGTTAKGQSLDKEITNCLRWRMIGPFRGGRTVA